ncbi:hypothetical protein [Streptomyces olivochromogenes]|uniref:hypothetical protein n=1 Tax=Streptomyces olivochromogenes TaxID=1963 RepID=UPI00131DDE0E|nr:hypothetical protein [Streptomyces olivochromogenes]
MTVTTSFHREDISNNAQIAHNTHTRNRRSGALSGRLKDRDALDVMRRVEQFQARHLPLLGSKIENVTEGQACFRERLRARRWREQPRPGHRSAP